MSYWYIEGERGRLLCWAKSPTFVCPFAAGVGGEDETTGEAERQHPLLVEARAHGITRLNEILGAAHRRYSASGQRLRVDGQLTDRCATCGARMRRLGFAAWEERPAAKGSSREGIAARLGFSSHERVGKTRYFRTKAKAEAWARRKASR